MTAIAMTTSGHTPGGCAQICSDTYGGIVVVALGLVVVPMAVLPS